LIGLNNFMLIKVKVFPASKKESVIKKSDDSFEVEVREKAERGLANRKLIEVFSFYFKVPPSQVRIIKGSRCRNKILEINKN